MGWMLRVGEGKASRFTLFRAVMKSVMMLNLLLLLGTAGFMLVEGWSLLDALFMTVITLSTVGYGEVQPLSDAGRVFTVLFIIISLGIATRALSELARYIAEGRLVQDVKARRARGELDAMKQHDIVIGYGRLGREIVADLLHHGREVLVVDRDAVEGLPAGVRLLIGDATLDDTLRDAGVEHARGLAIATPGDAVNVYITLSARQLNPKLVIQTRVEDEGAAIKARRAGATGVVMPYHIGGSRMAQALLRPQSSAFVDHATQRHYDDLHLEDICIGQNPGMHGKLKDLHLRRAYGVSVVAVQRLGHDGLEYPDADTEVTEGDTLVVVGTPRDVAEFVKLACP